MKRDLKLDCVKGVAMVLVIMGHIDYSPTQFEQWFYTFSLPLFVMTSGILLTKQFNLSTKVYIKKQMISLLYPYAVFSLIRIFQKAAFHHLIPDILNSVIKGLTLGGEGVLWYLPSLFFAEVFLFCIVKHKKYFIFSFLTGFVFLCSSYISSQYEGISEPLWYFLNITNRTFVMILLLAAGVAWKECTHIRNYSLWSVAAVGVLLGTYIMTPLIPKPDLIYSVLGNPIVYYLEAVLNSYSILILFYSLPFINTWWLGWIGKNSLLIYLTHTTFWITGWAGKTVTLAGFSTPGTVMGSACLLVLCVEIPIVYIIKNWFPWLYKYPFQRKKANP